MCVISYQSYQWLLRYRLDKTVNRDKCNKYFCNFDILSKSVKSIKTMTRHTFMLCWMHVCNFKSRWLIHTRPINVSKFCNFDIFWPNRTNQRRGTPSGYGLCVCVISIQSDQWSLRYSLDKMVNRDKSNKMFQSSVILTFFGRIEQNNDEAHLQVMVNACMKYQINPTTGLWDTVWTRCSIQTSPINVSKFCNFDIFWPNRTKQRRGTPSGYG